LLGTLLFLRRDPTGSARGSAVHPTAEEAVLEQALWADLARYDKTYLRAWSATLGGEAGSALDILAAFNELAYGVTGRGGLWRKTVPNRYFGCDNIEDAPVCARFKELAPSFSDWDQLQQQISEIDNEAAAHRFIGRNGERLRGYIETFAPADESISSVQGTPFFKENLARYAEQ
jgi:hypothetical protein